MKEEENKEKEKFIQNQVNQLLRRMAIESVEYSYKKGKDNINQIFGGESYYGFF